ncbi:MAG TPA: DUF2807 domain-containing protein [Dehalococcoidia bacterium]|nr:DUF2807 domain-containing protein [Dehalococcoidia bacterium]
MPIKNYSFTNFTGVAVGGAFEVNVQQSESFSVVVEADDLTLQSIKVSQNGDTLKIGRKWDPLSWIPGSSRPKATITMPVLKGLSLSGATTGTASGFSSPEEFRMELSGASRLNGDLETGEATIELSGASRAELRGSSGDLVIKVSGASKVTGDMTAGNTRLHVSGASHVELSGSGKALVVETGGASNVKLGSFSTSDTDIRSGGASRTTVNVTGKLDAKLGGASVLRWKGEPTMGDIRTSGASRLEKNG